MQISDPILKHVREQLSRLTSGIVTIPKNADNEKFTDVDTQSWGKATAFRDVSDDFMEQIKGAIEEIDYGHVSIHVEDDSMTIVCKKRKRFYSEKDRDRQDRGSVQRRG